MKITKFQVQLTVILLLSCTLFLWPIISHPTSIPSPNTPQLTDFTITHLPIAVYVNETVNNFHQVPLWNNLFFSGQPLITDPQSGYWYPPYWVTYLFPQPLSYNLLLLIHIFFTGLGMFLFLRKVNLGKIGALFSSIAWMGSSKLIGYVGGGHVLIVFAVCWTPWILLFIFLAMQKPNLKRGLLVGAAMAAILLANLQWGYYCNLLGSAFALFLAISKKTPVRQASIFFTGYFTAVIVLTAGLSLPLHEFLRFSGRHGMLVEEASIYPVTPNLIPGIVVPQRGIFYELVTFLGITSIILMFFGLKKKPWFWIILLVISFLLSFGSLTPLYGLFIKILPFANLLRVPSRFWFIVTLCIYILAGYGLEAIIYSEISVKTKKSFRFIGVTVSMFFVFFSIGLIFLMPDLAFVFCTVSILIILLFYVISKLLSKNNNHKILIISIFALLIFELVFMDRTMLKHVSPTEKPPAVSWLENQTGLFRAYSPTYSLPIPNSIEQANGVNPLHMRQYSEFMYNASNINSTSYSVSVPAIYIDEYTPDSIIQSASRPNLELLGLLNVKYIASDFPLDLPGIYPQKIFGRTLIYQNPFDRGRVWSETGNNEVVIQQTPNQIIIETKGDGGLLILSQVYYPGWVVWIDGEKQEIEKVYDLLMGVRLTPGYHFVKFQYIPTRFILGAIISITGWLFILFLCIRNKKKIVEVINTGSQ